MEDQQPVRLVLGLGNPGPRYARTRHNAGFLVLERLLGPGRWADRPRWQEAVVSLGPPTSARQAGPSSVLLVRPTTFMNLSGLAAEALLGIHGLTPSEMLVLSDDVFLPFGRLRLRHAGGAGGHKGLLSIEESLGTSAFPRLRLGVGECEPGTDLAEFVLAPLEGDAWRRFEELAERGASAVELICREGLATAMNRINPAPFHGTGGVLPG